jgi:hypothetical protein
MSFDVVIKYDEQELGEIRRMFADMPRTLPQIICRAINRTTKTVRAEIARRVAKETRQKVMDIKRTLKVKWASYRLLKSVIKLSTFRKPLIQYNAKQTEKGVTYSGLDIKSLISDLKERIIIKNQKPIVSAFIAKMQSVHEGVFIRKNLDYKQGRLQKGRIYRLPAKAFKKFMRLPISELYGPSSGRVFLTTENMASEIKDLGNRELQRNIDNQIRLALERRWSKEVVA